ncbi:hypothetical protein ACWGIU_14105 [Streptomyces sp. NPDC054840]
MSSNPAKGALIPAAPVARHIRNLMAAGVSVVKLSEASGVSRSIISGLLYRLSATRPRATKIREANARAILDVQPNDVVAGRIDSTGTKRRIQALVALGWPLLYIGPRISCHPYYVTTILKQDRVYARTAHAVAAAYDEMWNADPVAAGVPPYRASYCRNRASADGWPPPAAWDDDLIDDPAAQPERPDEMGRSELAAYRRQEIAHLASFGIPDHDIAARLGISDSTVQQQIRDMRKAA